MVYQYLKIHNSNYHNSINMVLVYHSINMTLVYQSLLTLTLN